MPNIPRKQLDAIQAQQQRIMLQTFNAIIADIRDQVVLSEVVRALEVGDVDAVIRLLGIDAPTWAPMEDAIRTAYREGGVTGASQLGRVPVAAGTVAARFDMRAPAAERWIASHSSQLITEIVTEQREVVRAVLTEGLAAGRAPRSTALEIIGRVDPVTNRRTGGVIGLTRNQQGWISNARRELSELDPAYFGRALRDKRLDGMVRRAIESGNPLSADEIDRAITRMQDKALKYRGDVIARTESINALREGQAQAIAQAVESSEIDVRDASKVWDASGDAKTRETHALADGQRVPVDQPFIVGGYQLMHPGDSSMGAPASETIQCRCRASYQIDYLGRQARIEGFG